MLISVYEDNCVVCVGRHGLHRIPVNGQSTGQQHETSVVCGINVMFEIIVGYVVCLAVVYLIASVMGWTDIFEKDEWE